MNGEPPIEKYDDYGTAAEYAIEWALKSGDGKILRSIKTLMDAVESRGAEVERLREERATIKEYLIAAIDEIVESCINHNSHQIAVRFRDAVNRAFAK